MHGPQEGLENDHAAHAIRVTGRPVQREDAAPVVAHEHDVTQVEPGEPRVEIPGMIMVPICALRLARTSHPDEIGREATATIGDERQDVSPHVRRRRVPMEEHDGRAGAGLAIGDERVEDAELVNGLSRGGGRHGIAPRQE